VCHSNPENFHNTLKFEVSKVCSIYKIVVFLIELIILVNLKYIVAYF